MRVVVIFFNFSSIFALVVTCEWKNRWWWFVLLLQRLDLGLDTNGLINITDTNKTAGETVREKVLLTEWNVSLRHHNKMVWSTITLLVRLVKPALRQSSFGSRWRWTTFRRQAVTRRNCTPASHHIHTLSIFQHSFIHSLYTRHNADEFLRYNHNKQHMHNIGLVHCNGLESIIIEFTSVCLI